MADFRHIYLSSTLYKSLTYNLQSTPGASSSLHHIWLMVLSTVLGSFHLFCILQMITCLSRRPHLSTTPCSSLQVSIVCAFAQLSIFFFVTFLPWSPKSWSSLFTVDADTGVWWVLLSAAACWQPVRCFYFKLHTLRCLSSCNSPFLFCSC